VTLTATWVRNTGSVRELIFAADSRLTGGETWDRSPKIFLLPRTDCAISSSGQTAYAFPLILQLINAIGAFERSRRRATDLAAAKGHALRVFDEMYSDVRDLPLNEPRSDPKSQFTFGGWSWREGEFRLWHLDWDVQAEAFTFRAVRPWREFHGVTVWFDGSVEAVWDARVALERLLRDSGRGHEARLGLEPLHILTAAINSGRYRDVGGSPQVAKVFRHMNTQLCKVEWSSHGGAPSTTFGGRPLFAYESVPGPTLSGADVAPPSLFPTPSHGPARSASGGWRTEVGSRPDRRLGTLWVPTCVAFGWAVVQARNDVQCQLVRVVVPTRGTRSGRVCTAQRLRGPTWGSRSPRGSASRSGSGGAGWRLRSARGSGDGQPMSRANPSYRSCCDALATVR
jgi:hypothetical protein